MLGAFADLVYSYFGHGMACTVKERAALTYTRCLHSSRMCPHWRGRRLRRLVLPLPRLPLRHFGPHKKGTCAAQLGGPRVRLPRGRQGGDWLERNGCCVQNRRSRARGEAVSIGRKRALPIFLFLPCALEGRIDSTGGSKCTTSLESCCMFAVSTMIPFSTAHLGTSSRPPPPP